MVVNLAWELTTSPAPGPGAYRPPATAGSRASTLLTLRDPERDDDPSAVVSVSAVPGTEVTVLATFRNQSQIVATFDVRVDWLPEGWSTVSPSTVFLNPCGSGTTASPSWSPTARALRRTCGCSPAVRTAALKRIKDFPR